MLQEMAYVVTAGDEEDIESRVIGDGRIDQQSYTLLRSDGGLRFDPDEKNFRPIEPILCSGNPEHLGWADHLGGEYIIECNNSDRIRS
jgi:hypothetical protein